jgi:hypothetical protein
MSMRGLLYFESAQFRSQLVQQLSWAWYVCGTTRSLMDSASVYSQSLWILIQCCIRYTHTRAHRLSKEECARLREGVPYVKVCQYNPKHQCPKLNGYGDNGQKQVWSSGGSVHCTCQLTSLIEVCPCVWCPMTAHASCNLHMRFL